MQKGNIETKTIKKAANNTFLKAFEADWLRYLGFSEAEIRGNEVSVNVEAGERKGKAILIFEKSKS